MLQRKEQKLIITIDNVSQADAIGLIKMFKYMQYLGNIGSSRFCSFFADGDGSFHPKVSFEYPEELPEIPEIDGIVTWDGEVKKLKGHPVSSEGDFAIDSDSIAWNIYHDEIKEITENNSVIKEPNTLKDSLIKSQIEAIGKHPRNNNLP